MAGFIRRTTGGGVGGCSGGFRVGNPVLLFLLILAFMVGFLASPLANVFQPPPPLVLAAPPAQACTNASGGTPVVAALAAAADVTAMDGFTSVLRTLPDDLLRFHYVCRTPPLSNGGAARAAVVDDVFDGVSPYAAFPPPHIRSMVRTQRIKGWGSSNPVFERLLREVRPRIVVELGTFLGASAIHMAKLMLAMASNDSTSAADDLAVFCLDDWRGWPGFRKAFPEIRQEHGNVMLYNQFLQNVVFSNVTGVILPLPFATTTGVYKLCDLGVKADLIEVDAGHDFHSAWSDINLAWSLMRDDGKSVMFGHDYFNANDHHGVRRAVDLFANLKGLRVEPDGQHWILRPGSPLSPKRKRKNRGGP